MANVELWRELGKQFRVDSVRSSDKAGSGHPTSSMSAADLMAVLISNYLQYDFENPDNPNNDHLVFSKGHASPLLYAMFKAAQAISDEEIAIVSDIPLARVRAIYDSRTWDEISVGELRSFCAACDFDPENSADRNRLTAYRNQKGGPKFTYLKDSSQWKSVFMPLIKKYFNASNGQASGDR